MLLLIRNGELYDPAPRGRTSVLIDDEIDTVVSRGRVMMREGTVVVADEFAEELNRRFSFTGRKDDPRLERSHAVR